MMEQVYEDPLLGKVVFRKRRGLKSLGIRVHPLKGVSVSVPYRLPFSFARVFFNLKREWVVRTVERQRQRYGNIPKAQPEQIEALRTVAKEQLPLRLKELADRYGFVYNRVAIKHNSTNWGSCSSKGNINLNLNIVRLPHPLRDYIMLHELCHLRHHDHGEAFHLLLEHVGTDNLLKLSEGGDSQVMSIMKSVASSGARYPVDHVCTGLIKGYPLI